MPPFFSGYIEGYYGKMLTWEQRSGLVQSFKKLGLNSYVYAPKDDPLHRHQWHKPYSPRWNKAYQALVKDCQKNKIHFIPGVSPGLSYDYLSKDDYKSLLHKIISFFKGGVNYALLLMDDIPNQLPKNCLAAFNSLGEAHGKLLQNLKDDIRKKYPKAKLWFCPTVYTDQFVKGSIKQNNYLLDLSRTIPLDVHVLWTGPKIISETISKSNTRDICSLFPGKVIIWDNYYANDYCPRKIFLGKFRGRSSNMQKYLAGLLLNPTGLYNTDLLYMQLLSYCLRGFSPTEAWKKLFHDTDIPASIPAFIRYFDSPGSPLVVQKEKKGGGKKSIKQINHILFEWTSPLATEWFPFFQGLKHDLMLGDPKLSATERKKLLCKFPDSLRPYLK